MKNKIQVVDPSGEVRIVDANAKLSELISCSGYASADDIAADIHADMKGISAHKIKEVIQIIIDNSNGYFEGVQQLRDGTATPQFRLLIEEVAPSDSVASTPEQANVEDEPEATKEIESDRYEEALELVLSNRLCSPSFLERKLKIDFYAAVELLERIEKTGAIVRVDGVDDYAWQMADTAEQPEDSNEAEEEPGPYADSTEDSAHLRGQKARMRKETLDQNPFEGGSEDFVAWEAAHNATSQHIAELTNLGYEDGINGKTRRACKYESGTPNAELWEAGFIKGRAEFEKTKQADHSDDSDTKHQADNYSLGRAAGIEGQAREDNPHPAGMTKHRLWDQGWEEGNAQRLDAQGQTD